MEWGTQGPLVSVYSQICTPFIFTYYIHMHMHTQAHTGAGGGGVEKKKDNLLR